MENSSHKAQRVVRLGASPYLDKHALHMLRLENKKAQQQQQQQQQQHRNFIVEKEKNDAALDTFTAVPSASLAFRPKPVLVEIPRMPCLVHHPEYIYEPLAPTTPRNMKTTTAPTAATARRRRSWPLPRRLPTMQSHHGGDQINPEPAPPPPPPSSSSSVVSLFSPGERSARWREYRRRRSLGWWHMHDLEQLWHQGRARARECCPEEEASSGSSSVAAPSYKTMDLGVFSDDDDDDDNGNGHHGTENRISCCVGEHLGGRQVVDASDLARYVVDAEYIVSLGGDGGDDGQGGDVDGDGDEALRRPTTRYGIFIIPRGHERLLLEATAAATAAAAAAVDTTSDVVHGMPSLEEIRAVYAAPADDDDDDDNDDKKKEKSRAGDDACTTTASMDSDVFRFYDRRRWIREWRGGGGGGGGGGWGDEDDNNDKNKDNKGKKKNKKKKKKEKKEGDDAASWLCWTPNPDVDPWLVE